MDEDILAVLREALAAPPTPLWFWAEPIPQVPPDSLEATSKPSITHS